MAKRQKRTGPSTTKPTEQSAEANAGTAPQKPRIDFVGLAEAPRIYSNLAQMAMSLYDFRLMLCEVVEATAEGGTATVRAIVFLSPQHAKGLAGLIANKVEEYEARFGEISSQAKASDAV